MKARKLLSDLGPGSIEWYSILISNAIRTLGFESEPKPVLTLFIPILASICQIRKYQLTLYFCVVRCFKSNSSYPTIFWKYCRGSGLSRASMTSLSPLSESPSTSSLSLSPSAFIQPDTSAMHRIKFEELLHRAEVRFLPLGHNRSILALVFPMKGQLRCHCSAFNKVVKYTRPILKFGLPRYLVF